MWVTGTVAKPAGARAPGSIRLATARRAWDVPTLRAGGVFDLGEDFRHGVGDAEEIHVRWFEKFVGEHPVEELEQWIVKAFLVQEDTGFLHDIELAQSEDFHDFLERAPAAGERDEGVGARFHDGFALAEVARDDEFVRCFVGDLAVTERLRNDADHASAGALHGNRELAHQADAGPAIDKGEAALTEERAELDRRLGVVGVHGIAG